MMDRQEAAPQLFYDFRLENHECAPKFSGQINNIRPTRPLRPGRRGCAQPGHQRPPANFPEANYRRVSPRTLRVGICVSPGCTGRTCGVCDRGAVSAAFIDGEQLSGAVLVR